MKRAELERLFGGDASIVETHLSLVVLTGEWAYKWKKSVLLPFVDQSTAERRRDLCRAEVALNKRYAPSVYVGVSALTKDGKLSDAPQDESSVVEWCVKMHRFHMEGDKALAAGLLTVSVVRQFAEDIAAIHSELPRAAPESHGTEQKDQMDNVEYLEQHWEADKVVAVRTWLEEVAGSVGPSLKERRASGSVRECHGDLHLTNTVLLEGRLVAFDCLEFNQALRTTDVCADIAFFIMDLDYRRVSGLGCAFLSQYLETSGDYGALALLRYFLIYRTMVRAKIHCIGGNLERTLAHVELGRTYMEPLRPLLVLMHGVSGSGKSYVAAELVTVLRAVRVRSDVERKRLFGLRPLEASSDAIKTEMYGSKGSAMVLQRVLQVAEIALVAKWNVIVDATTLKRDWRNACRELCERVGARFVLVHCRADVSVLRERVRARREGEGDASEAGEEVLEKQLAGEEPLGEDEPHMALDTSHHVTPEQVAQFAESFMK